MNCRERLKLIQPGSSRPWKGSSTSETRERAALSHSGVWYLLQQRGRQERDHQLERKAKKCVVAMCQKWGLNENDVFRLDSHGEEYENQSLEPDVETLNKT